MQNQTNCCGHRRQFLWETGAGFTGLALSSLLDTDGFFSKHASAMDYNPLTPKLPHFPVKAKRCIFLFMYGGPSAVDTFDYKPELQKRDGQEIDVEFRRRKVKKQKLLASQRKFARYGESGLWCSDAFPNIAQHMDKFCVIKSLQADSFAHGSAVLQMNSGQIILGS
ncbi:MAG: DUF1501 domain-containing protein, partial [Pirellulales bacterium]|nr:DUF1501 domain-containing protein [Pirellulales bacterium]